MESRGWTASDEKLRKNWSPLGRTMNHEKAMPDRKRLKDVGTKKKSRRFSWVVKAGTKKAQNS